MFILPGFEVVSQQKQSMIWVRHLEVFVQHTSTELKVQRKPEYTQRIKRAEMFICTTRGSKLVKTQNLTKAKHEKGSTSGGFLTQ
jgi:hypothetical protein